MLGVLPVVGTSEWWMGDSGGQTGSMVRPDHRGPFGPQ